MQSFQINNNNIGTKNGIEWTLGARAAGTPQTCPPEARRNSLKTPMALMRVIFLPQLCPPQIYFASCWYYLTHYPRARSAESAYVRIGLQNSGAFGTATYARVAFPDMAGLYPSPYGTEGETKGLGLISDYGKDGGSGKTGIL